MAAKRSGRNAKADTLVRAAAAAYRLVPDRREWLAAVTRVVGPAIGGGAGVIAFFYDVRRPLHDWFREGATFGVSTDDVAFLRDAFDHAGSSDIGRIHGKLPMTELPRFARVSQFLGAVPSRAPEMGTIASRLGLVDVVGINVPVGEGHGVIFNVFETEEHHLHPSRLPSIAKLASHVGAAARLRDRAGKAEAAVFAVDGKLLHATAETARSAALSEHARAFGAAITRRPEAAHRPLDAWTPLVEGRWSLLERLERDGKRFLVVHENAPDFRDPRALTAAERAVAQLVALGDANKHIAYELGRPLGTVSRIIHRIAKKLDVPTRAALVDRVRFLRRASVTRPEGGAPVLVLGDTRTEGLPAAFATLSDAEREVALRAARGEPSARIAESRKTSVRTVSNQLATVYAKLRIRSRADLARLLAGG